MIQERLGIVNQANRFSQRAWHDSLYDFDWFIKQNMEKSRNFVYEYEKSAQWAQSEEGDSLNKGDTQDALSVSIVSNAFQNVKTENDLELARKEHPWDSISVHGTALCMILMYFIIEIRSLQSMGRWRRRAALRRRYNHLSRNWKKIPNSGRNR